MNLGRRTDEGVCPYVNMLGAPGSRRLLALTWESLR